MSSDKLVVMMCLVALILGAMVAAFYKPHPIERPANRWTILHPKSP